MHEYEARVGPLGDVRRSTLPSMMMIMADPSTKARFRKEGCTTDLDRLNREIEGLCDLYKPTRPTFPFGFISLGDSRVWRPVGAAPADGYAQEELDAWDAQQNAGHAERQRLNAIGKGKGKGAKGWQKGEGKGKGKDSQRVVRDSNAAETRGCHSCQKTGHLTRDCPEPPSAATQAWQKKQQQRQGTQQGQARSLAERAPAMAEASAGRTCSSERMEEADVPVASQLASLR